VKGYESGKAEMDVRRWARLGTNPRDTWGSQKRVKGRCDKDGASDRSHRGESEIAKEGKVPPALGFAFSQD
jgi:hypothetical protein